MPHYADQPLATAKNKDKLPVWNHLGLNPGKPAWPEIGRNLKSAAAWQVA